MKNALDSGGRVDRKAKGYGSVAEQNDCPLAGFKEIPRPGATGLKPAESN
jgi:hypothetical protein